jgi:phosphatidylinositol alpha-mannosyltransferase
VRLGIVCPYSLDVPGGVQFHIRDLAEHLIALGHDVSVLAPADDDTPVPPYVVPAGRALPVPYNGSVARLTFGPLTSARVRRWLSEGDFDLVHLHEPQIPSLSLITLWAADEVPVVATFHTSIERSRVLTVSYPFLRPAMEKISARIAVSEDARRTLVEHLGGDAVVIPNGVDCSAFTSATPQPRWQGTPQRRTLAFLGRIDEPRKGLQVLADAFGRVRREVPGVHLFVAGRGDLDEGRERFGADAEAVTFLGEVSEGDKADLLASVDAYVAPQTGGESFGIVLVEAMSAGAAVVASDLGAFRRVLDEGRCGALFTTGDPASLGERLVEVLHDDARRAELRARGSQWVRRYDWDTVADQLLEVYAMVAPDPSSREGRRVEGEDEETLGRRLLGRFRR